MSQRNKPEGMSASEWRLWCCCRPTVSPPSSPAQRDHVSLDEFDPGNRLSMSRAYEHNTQPHPSPSTVTKNHESSPPAGHSGHKNGTPPQSAYTHAEYKAPQRPTTVLLPNLPERPVRTLETKVTRDEQSKPTFVRQDSEAGEKWWQVGRRRLDRKDKSGSPKGEDRERSERE